MTTSPLQLGARVWVGTLKANGLVTSLSRDGKRATVEIDKVRFNVAVADLQPARRETSHGPVARKSGSVRRPAARRAPAPEIDMHGLRVEEMLQQLERFLDEAMLAGLPEVRIIHGHGTGALRAAVHRHLKALGVRHFRLGEPGQTPGGDGVTLVSL